MSKNIDKRVWGVLGKQQTYFSPQKQVEGKTKTPLNANAFDSWDSKRSRFKRVDGYDVSDAAQQGGTVIGQSTSVPVSSPTPTPTITQTQTQTPSQTATQTNTPTPSFTPTLTPSSTPYPLPSTPALWYDASNVGSIDYISSGGTNYVSAWRSIGTYNKTLTGATTDTMPQISGSTKLPGSPNIVRFTKNATTSLQDYLTQRFDSQIIPQSGLTIFYVITNPGYSYSTTVASSTGFGTYFTLYSGNTTNGGFTPLPGLTNQPIVYNNFFSNTANVITTNYVSSGTTYANNIPNYSATNINDKFLYTQVYPYPTGFPYYEINQSGGTASTQITATTATGINAVNIGGNITSGGTITAINSGIEIAEIMVYNTVLSIQEQEAVQNYLRDKWRYDEWASPVPTPTQTASSTATPTPSPTRPASGTTEAQTYLRAVVDAGGTGITSTVSAATTTLFTS